MRPGNIIKNALFALLILSSSGGLFAQSYLGNWIQSDANGKDMATVQVYRCGQNICGRYLGLLDARTRTPRCEKCPGNWKDKPLRGLIFLYGLKPGGTEAATGGKLLDTATGTIQNCKIKIGDDGLRVLIYGLFSFLGKTQIWRRAGESP